MSRLVQRLEGERAIELEPDGPKFLKQIMEDLKESSCWNCSDCSPLEKVCDGGEDDHRIVAEGGHCIERLRSLFQAACEITLAYYSEYASAMPHDLPEIRLFTEFSHDRPHTVPIEAYVGGKMQPRERDGRHFSDVILSFAVREFDWKTYLSSFYVLLHECFCHAYQWIVPSAASREDFAGQDYFTDGWMDYLVRMVLDNLSSGLGPAERLARALPHMMGHVEAGAEWHIVRGDMSRSDEDRYRMAWMVVVGVRAAKEVRKRLNRLSKSPDEHFLRMSLDLNLQQLTEKERDDFAHTLYQLTKHSAARPSDIRPVDFELDRVLSDYCQSSSIQSLLSGVQSLKCRFI